MCLFMACMQNVPRAQLWASSTKISWLLSKDHPRNNKTNCIAVTTAAGVSAIDLYHELKSNTSMYLVRAKSAFVHESGIIGLPCGYFQAIEACETIFKFLGRKWWNKCTNLLQKSGSSWDLLWNSRDDGSISNFVSFNASACSDKLVIPKRYKRVFTIAALWDHNYHHFLIDSLSRLIRNLPFLFANPDIMIHIREYEQFSTEARYILGGKRLRNNIFNLIGLNMSRFIAGPVLANEVYFPRAVKCNYPLRHSYEIRYRAKSFNTLHGRK
jgi:hypothetical protein